jgi:hypothetical protein
MNYMRLAAVVSSPYDHCHGSGESKSRLHQMYTGKTRSK